MGYLKGKELHWRGVQIPSDQQAREDTKRFRITPAPAVASSPHEGLQRPLRAAPKPRVDARVDAEIPAQEQTKEIVPGSARHANGRLSEDQQKAEMVEIMMVHYQLKVSFLSHLGAAERGKLESVLTEAERKASEVAEGCSPKREFFARIPFELQPQVRFFYQKADAIEV